VIDGIMLFDEIKTEISRIAVLPLFARDSIRPRPQTYCGTSQKLGDFS
jgi:hypothetical protein